MRELVILSDVWIPPYLEERLIRECGVTLVQCGASMADAFWEKLLRPRLEASAQPLLAVVEGSGEEVWAWMHARVAAWLPRPLISHVFAKRIVSRHPRELINWRRDPYWIAGEIPTVRFIEPSVTDVILIDDVIGSGNTMRKLRERNAWKFPRAAWQAIAWVGRAEAKPRMSWEVMYRVESPDGKRVPINSISTLLKEPALARDYAQRNLRDSDRFLAILDEINSEKEAAYLHENVGPLH